MEEKKQNSANQTELYAASIKPGLGWVEVLCVQQPNSTIRLNNSETNIIGL